MKRVIAVTAVVTLGIGFLTFPFWCIYAILAWCAIMGWC